MGDHRPLQGPHRDREASQARPGVDLGLPAEPDRLGHLDRPVREHLTDRPWRIEPTVGGDGGPHRVTSEAHQVVQHHGLSGLGPAVIELEPAHRPGQSAQIAAHAARHGLEDDDDRLVLMRGVFMNPYWSSASVSERLVPDFVNALRRGIEAVGT